MSSLATLSPAERQRLTRMETTTISPQPTPADDGFTTWSRDTAEAVRDILRGTAWRAEARAPYWPHPENEVHGQLIIAVDRRWLIVHTHTVPARTDRDLYTLTVNGRAIPYSLHRGDLPHQPETVALTVWRHVNDATFGECATLLCDEPPTVATYGATLCPVHASGYAPPRRFYK